MPSTYTSNNKIQKIATGEQSGSWGNTTNTNFDLFDTAIDGFVSVTLSGTTHTLNIPDGSAGDGRNKVLVFTGTLAATNTISVTPNTVKKHYYVQNNTTGSQNIVISQGSGSSVTVKPGYSSIVYLDGAGSSAAVKEVLTSLKLTALIEATGAVLNGSSSGSTTLQASATASGTITLPAATDTLVGKATTDTFTNKTFDTAGTGNVLRINGTQVSAVTGSGSVVLATSPTLVTPLLGTPTSGTLTNCTGLPISTGVSGLGSNVATFLATPSSANLAAAVTDETGTGALVFGTSPTIATPTITTSAIIPLINGGTAASSTLTLQSTSGVGTSDAIIFKTASQSEKMRIDSSGNVLVGATSSSLGKFVTSGSQGYANQGSNIVVCARFQTGSNNAILFDTIGVTNASGYRRGIWWGYGIDDFNISRFTNDGTTTFITDLHVSTAGNVGIGTTSPLTKLQVGTAAGGVGADGNTTLSAGTLMVYGVATSGAALTWNAYTNGGNSNTVMAQLKPRQDTSANYNLDVFCGTWNNNNTPGTAVATFQSTGNMGIGATSPKQKLHVSGQGLFTSSAASYDPGDSAGPAVRIGYNSSDYGYVISSETGVISKRLLVGGSTVEFLIYGAEKMRIDNNGVGIGTSSPSYQLQLSTDSAAKPSTNTWTIASDSRLKTVKGEYQKGLAEICQVRPVRYEYNGKAGFIADGKEQVSILAQELMQVFPECVDMFKGKLEEDGPEIDLYNYNGHAITFALINAIKELKAEIDILKARN